MFRRGGGNRFAAFLFAPGRSPNERGGISDDTCHASVVSICHVRETRYAAGKILAVHYLREAHAPEDTDIPDQ